MTDFRNRIVGYGTKPASQFLAHPLNHRKHPQSQRRAMTASLTELGWVNAVIENVRTGRLIDGHERIWQALQADDSEVPFIQVDLAPEEEHLALAILDRITGMAEVDPAMLNALIEDVNTGEPALQELLAQMADEAGIVSGDESTVDAEPQIDKAEELRVKWGVETGQLWELGDHRIVCGDCTDADVVMLVMGGELARTIFTDPPYGIGKKIENDNLKREDWIEFYRKFTDSMLSCAMTNAYVFVWGYFDGLSDYWQEIVKARGDCNFRNFIIWRKKNVQGMKNEEFRQFPEEYEAALFYIFGQPFQNGPWSVSPNAEYYNDIFEPIRAYLDGERKKMGWDVQTVKKLVGHSDLSGDHWFGRSQWEMPTRNVYSKLQEAARGDAFRRDYDDLRRDYDDLRGYFDNTNGYTDIWQFQTETRDDRHPTVKPVELCERGIVSTSQTGEIVLDVFLGSGTTLIACEQLGRRCRAVEISPGYVAVALQRWADATGKEPKLLTSK